uniref:aldehyde dehydrogenase family protein n=1 Tax=Staphylococcus epidermidis TaxID=1282 RepID=UPI0011A3F8A3
LQSSVYHQLFPKLKEPFQNVKVRDPFHQHTKITPQTRPQQLHKIQTYIKIPQEHHKPNILTPPHPITHNPLHKGYFF